MASSPLTAPPPNTTPSSTTTPPSPPTTPSPVPSPPSSPPPSSPPPPASPPPESPPPPQPSPSPPPPSSSPPPPPQPVEKAPSVQEPTFSPPPPPQAQSALPVNPPSSGSLSPSGAVGGGNKSPPSPSKKSPSKGRDGGKSNDGQSEVSLPTVIGVTVGVGLFVVLMLVGLVICVRKKKKKKTPMHYYDAPGFKGGFYPAGSLPKWQNGANDIELNGKLPPPPGAHIPQGGGWNAPPVAPLAQVKFSGEMSSEYSGHQNRASSRSMSTDSLARLELGFNKSSFSLEELSAATSGFSENNLLGQGGFGYVFKGVLPNGKEIAVKQLKAGSGQGEREFQAEIEIISRVHHRHLVSLVGYCIAGPQRLLVYEFVPNKTLEYHLRGSNQPPMDWPTRLKIAIGSAKGLAYLHEDCHPRIIHRDIKAANILLDYKFDAKVADFGLAKLSEDTNTHVSTRIMGTFGYLAPEYASTGKLTEKSDVFSFGVMLLELITGRPPIDRTHTFMEDSLAEWAEPLMTKALAEDNYEELIDPRLQNAYDNSEVTRMVASAAACIRHSASRRPKMSKIVRALEGDLPLHDLNEGMKPSQSRLFSSSSDLDSDSYTTNHRQFRSVAHGSNDGFTEGYSGVSTSEYGHDTTDSSSSGEMHDPQTQKRKNLHVGMETVAL